MLTFFLNLLKCHKTIMLTNIIIRSHEILLHFWFCTNSIVYLIYALWDKIQIGKVMHIIVCVI